MCEVQSIVSTPLRMTAACLSAHPSQGVTLRGSRSRGQQDLADVAALLHLAVRGRSGGERMPRVHDGPHPSGLHQGPDVLAHGGHDGSLLLERPGP